MPVPTSCSKSSTMKRYQKLIGSDNISNQIERSTVTESDFRLPMSLDRVETEINPVYASQIMSAVLRDLEQCELLAKDNERKQNAWRSLKVDMLACLTSPTSSYNHIHVYVLWMALVYTIDDIRDKFLESTHYKDKPNLEKIVEDTNEDILCLVDPEADEMPALKYFRPDHAVVKLARRVRTLSFKALSVEAYTEFVGHLDVHLRQGVTLAFPYMMKMKEDTTFPMTVQEFEDLRVKDSAGAMCVHLASGVAYNNRVQSDILEECLQLTALHAAILNDIFSYEKQIHREQDRFNYICGVQEELDLSFDEAVHFAVRRANELVDTHIRLANQIDPDDIVSQRIIDTQRRWLAGHLVWVKSCGRYSSSTSPFKFLRSVQSTMDNSLSPENPAPA